MPCHAKCCAERFFFCLWFFLMKNKIIFQCDTTNCAPCRYRRSRVTNRPTDSRARHSSRSPVAASASSSSSSSPSPHRKSSSLAPHSPSHSPSSSKSYSPRYAAAVRSRRCRCCSLFFVVVVVFLPFFIVLLSCFFIFFLLDLLALRCFCPCGKKWKALQYFFRCIKCRPLSYASSQSTRLFYSLLFMALSARKLLTKKNSIYFFITITLYI